MRAPPASSARPPNPELAAGDAYCIYLQHTINTAPQRARYPTETNMEQWINRLLMGCGGASGLMLGTDHVVEATTLAAATIFAVWFMRMQARSAAEER